MALEVIIDLDWHQVKATLNKPMWQGAYWTFIFTWHYPIEIPIANVDWEEIDRYSSGLDGGRNQNFIQAEQRFIDFLGQSANARLFQS